MKEDNFQSKVFVATKWSSITEIATKLVSPITNMILARLLTPEAFGVVATISMIISFADMFADSGFQKYLVQHQFKSEKEKYRNANVAFWTNFGISIILWFIIFIFRDQIASLVGNTGLGIVLAIGCLQLPLTSFSSIQISLYQRDFNFKLLFLVRIISVFIPVFITIPLALLGLGYWSIIIGTLTMQFSNAMILTYKSKWKPQFFYNIKIFKEMYSFSIWSLIESISIWLSVWVDTFVIASLLDTYYLGLYKTSTSMVSTITSIITSSVVPILFSTLSRLQDDESKFNNVFLKFQRLISILVLPLGVGIYLYNDFATQLLLGDKWREASGVIGVWALTRSIKIVLGDLSSEVYRSKGRPKLSFLAQTLHLVFLVPTCIISAKLGFWILVYARSWVQMQFIIVHFILMKIAFGFKTIKIIKNIFPTAASAVVMGTFGLFLKQFNDGIFWTMISILLCAFLYLIILFMFTKIRMEILLTFKQVVSKNSL